MVHIAPQQFTSITFINNNTTYTLSRKDGTSFNMDRPLNGQVLFSYNDGTNTSKKYLGVDYANDFTINLVDNYIECPKVIGINSVAADKSTKAIEVILNNTNEPRQIIILTDGTQCSIISIE